MSIAYQVFKIREALFDIRHGIQTRKAPVASHKGSDEQNQYAPINPRHLRFILSQLVRKYPQHFSSSIFCDLGFGLGRAFAVAADYGFQKFAGAEIKTQLKRQIEINLKHMQMDHQFDLNFDLFWGDAQDFKFPLEPLTLFMFNPFGPETTKRVFRNLSLSLRANPRPVLLVYATSHYTSLIEDVLRDSSQKWAMTAIASPKDQPFFIYKNF